MKKRGMSRVVTVVLFILLGISLISSLGFFIVRFAGQSLSEKQSSQNCVQEVEIEILNACHDNNLLKITVKNKRELTLGDFFLVKITYENQSTEDIPTAYHTYVQGYETKDIIIPYTSQISKIKVIPKIEAQNYLCTNSAPVFEGIKECGG